MIRRLQLSEFDSNYHVLVQVHLIQIYRLFCTDSHSALGNITWHTAVPRHLVLVCYKLMMPHNFIFLKKLMTYQTHSIILH